MYPHSCRYPIYPYPYPFPYLPLDQVPASPLPVEGSSPMPAMEARYSKAYLNLQNALRSLWEQHIAWTRMTVDAIVDGSPDEEATTKRLLRNASDMGNALQPLYGGVAAAEFTNLIKDHLIIAATLVKQLKTHNSNAAETKKKWYQNAVDIAAFLAKANPLNWTFDEWKKMLHEHLDILTQQVLARLQKNYPLNIEIYDKGEQQALEMADMLAEGIAKQFPEQFEIDYCRSVSHHISM